MKSKGKITKDNEIWQGSQSKLPYGFEITIKTSPKRFTRTFEVSGTDAISGQKKTKKYLVHSDEHKSYTDFFKNLAEDFGSRIPKNGEPSFKPTFKAKYQALLTENIAPTVLYGYGDPAVLKVDAGFDGKDSWYYLVSTSNDAPDSFPILRSKNLVDWELVGFVLPRGRKPEWALDGEFISDYWAPEMHKIGGEFRVYFAARDKNTRELCIGMANSSRPDGPFIAGKVPILKGGVIDPHIFVESDEIAYLYWKQDNNDIFSVRLNDLLSKHPDLIAEIFAHKEDQITACFIQTLWSWAKNLEPMERFLVLQILIEAAASDFSAFQDKLRLLKESQSYATVQEDIQLVLEAMKTPIYAQKLSADGRQLVGERVKIIENDQIWEAHLVEGMWVVRNQGKYYLFYAGNDFSTEQYGIGVAIADLLLGPYKKMSEPFLRSTPDWYGPGHPSVALGPDGKPLLFLHAFYPGKTGYKEFRALLAAPIEFKPDRVVLR